MVSAGWDMVAGSNKWAVRQCASFGREVQSRNHDGGIIPQRG
jgi:hypothetical protein